MPTATPWPAKQTRGSSVRIWWAKFHSFDGEAWHLPRGATSRPNPTATGDGSARAKLHLRTRSAVGRAFRHHGQVAHSCDARAALGIAEPLRQEIEERAHARQHVFGTRIKGPHCCVGSVFVVGTHLHEIA